MKVKQKIFLLVCILLFFTSTVFAGAADRFVLNNGLTVVLKEDHTADVASLQAWVKAGATTEGKFSGAGISHFTEHMLFKGTTTRKVGQIGREVKALGGDTNAYTSFDKTVFLLNLPGHNIKPAIEILSDALRNSVFDVAEIEKEREVILKEIKMGRDDPQRYLTRLTFETAYRVHPYRYPVIGYEELFRDLTRTNLLEYYRTMYVPNNIVLVAAGDFDAHEILDIIRKEFSGWKRKEISPAWKFRPGEPTQISSRGRKEEYSVRLARALLVFPSSDLFSPDLYPLDSLAIILGKGKTSRFWRSLREEKKLVYTIGAFSYTPRDRGIFGIEMTLAPENLEQAKSAVFAEIDKIRKEGVTAAEITSAYKRARLDYFSAGETVEGQVASLASDEVTAGSLDFSERYVRGMKEVTARDIKRIAGEYLVPEKMSEVVLLPLSGVSVLSVKPTLSDIAQRPPAIEKKVLANGIIVLTRVDTRIPLVAVQGLFPGGIRMENEQTNGITKLMVTVMQKGAAGKGAAEIASLIENSGGSLSGFSGYNSFGFSLQMPAEDIAAGLEVLADIIRKPAFPAAELKKEKANQLAAIRAQEDNIFSAADKYFRETMFIPHPYQFKAVGRKDAIEKITRDKLVNFYQQRAAPQGMVISISGDIDRDKVTEMIERLFAGWQKKQRAAFSPPAPDFPDEVRAAAKKLVGKEQSVMMLGFPGVSIYDKDDLYAFYLLEGVLNGQGGRIFKVLRDELSLAYALGSYTITGVDQGAFVFYVATVSEKKEAALKALEEQIFLLSKELLPEDEIVRAKNELIGTYAFGLQTNSQISFQAGLDELYGLGYDYHTAYAKRVNGITAEKLRAVVRKYLDLSRYTLVSVGPDEGL